MRCYDARTGGLAGFVGVRTFDPGRQLPYGQWREADLDYKGGHRGAKRLIFSREGRRFVTVDHYRTFTEIPACQ